jgi:sugar-specific transcriptional regulator TrmB
MSLIELHMDLKKLVQQLGGDFDALTKEYLEISSNLSPFGLSDYESKAYIALVALGPTSANLVAQVAQIPRTSAYKALKRLALKRFVIEQKGRPVSFAPVDPSQLADTLAAKVKESFGKISRVKDLLSERGVPQLVYTIMGKERVLDKIGEMLDKSAHTLVMSSPSISVIRHKLGKRFTNAVSRGVNVTVITSPFVKAPQGVKVIRRKGLIATDVISDGKTALLAAPDLSACGYTDNETLSRHLEDFLRIMGERSD